jgi:hypothetical protein
MPQYDDLFMVRGDTKSWELTFTRGGAPINLVAGTLIWMTAKRDLVEIDTAAVFKKGIGTGVTITDAANGVARVDLVNADTQPLLDRDYVLFADVQLKELDGRISSFPYRLHVTCDVTELVS